MPRIMVLCAVGGGCPVEQAAEMSIDDSRIDERFEAWVRVAELGSEPAVRDLHRAIRHVMAASCTAPLSAVLAARKCCAGG
jgi:hypothetical protein